MKYEETKQYGAHSIINTTFYGCGHYIVNAHEPCGAVGQRQGVDGSLYSRLRQGAFSSASFLAEWCDAD